MKHSYTSINLEILTFIAIFFAEIQAALLAIGFLVMSDTFTGIWGAWKQNGIKSITSRKAGRIITKLVMYPLAIIVAKVSQEYLTPIIPWVEVTSGIIATVEIKSIYENMGDVLGFDLWKRLKAQIWKDKEE